MFLWFMCYTEVILSTEKHSLLFDDMVSVIFSLWQSNLSNQKWSLAKLETSTLHIVRFSICATSGRGHIFCLDPMTYSQGNEPDLFSLY